MVCKPSKRRAALTLAGVVSGTIAGTAGTAVAGSFDTGNPDVTLRWDNTVKYSAAARVASRDPAVAGSIPNSNLDDGDLNFGRGLISNRFDLLSELDVAYARKYGVRLSGAAWYDSVYNRKNDNDSPGTINHSSTAYNEFTRDTRRLHGRNAELLDAFAYGNFDIGDKNLSLRAGRYTLLYGESLFLGANGIAAAQSSIDVVKALSVPNSQFKEIGRPIGQVSGQFQATDDLTLGAYYQLEWRKYRLPASGSYFSVADILDEGGEVLYASGPMFGPGGLYFGRGSDIKAKNSGQGGLQIRYKVSPNWEFGLYGANFHDKTPKIYVRPGVNAQGQTSFGTSIGDYVLVYPENIQVYGASFATVVGDTNISGEFSVRNNQPFAGANGDVFVDPTGLANGSGRRLYPVGKSAHVNISAISVLNGNSLWDGASLIGELGYNHRLTVDNDRPLDPRVTRGAWGTRISFEANYFQVLPQVDLTVPISVGYAFGGRSSLGPAVFGPEKGGDITIGLTAEYEKRWRMSLQYVKYFGAKGPLTLDPVQREYSYKQTLADRDYVSLSLQTTF
ncbi:hypothetical protein M2352_004926 [Azospirillum fermentarium]|uniref:DUF1302 domain-containing protein n=1 Tax=Azospirillum fermentarium TaxID=1233114 RepID=UPI0022272273|nr:DUF1302 domain-containing protein [Azospirillum fermentarium]MCW2249266.1 hypothetical protein [Azospirillum fermentarium]